MKNTVTEYEFRDTMVASGFSYDGATALFEWYEQCEAESGAQEEFYPVAIRGDWDEYKSVAECCAEYGDNINTLEDLQNHTPVVEFEHGILIMAF